ncbi:MAG TPA: glycosyltransferase family protein [Azospirillaceae bacterium]|nr:glycosyltransferase family protein [Azospirillaceae bacterium]
MAPLDSMAGSDRRPVVSITQARMTSSRLPGKVLREVAGKPLLAWHLERVKRARRIDSLALATSDLPSDDPVEALGLAMGVKVYRGPENDVLERFRLAWEGEGAATVVRLTGDCPLIDPGLIDAVVAAYLDASEPVDHMALDMGCFPNGVNVEVVARAALDAAAREARAPGEREHVTPFIYRRPDRFRLAATNPGGDPAYAAHRWCVDEAADFALVQWMIETLAPIAPAFTWRECLSLVQANPARAASNRHVVQRSA